MWVTGHSQGPCFPSLRLLKCCWLHCFAPFLLTHKNVGSCSCGELLLCTACLLLQHTRAERKYRAKDEDYNALFIWSWEQQAERGNMNKCDRIRCLWLCFKLWQVRETALICYHSSNSSWCRAALRNKQCVKSKEEKRISSQTADKSSIRPFIVTYGFNLCMTGWTSLHCTLKFNINTQHIQQQAHLFITKK